MIWRVIPDSENTWSTIDRATWPIISGTGALVFASSIVAGLGAAGKVEILAPANQEIVTVSVEYTVSVLSYVDTEVSIYDGETLLGAATDNEDGTFSYAWTPETEDYDVNLIAVGNVSGNSTTISVVVAESNAISQDFTNWSKKNASITVTGGQADPDGGTAAYLVTGYEATNTQMQINKAATVTPTEFNSGFEIWAKPNGLNVLMIYPLEDGSNNYAYIDLESGQSRVSDALVKIVERKSDGWVRIWFNFQDALAGPKSYYLYLCNTIGDLSPDVSAGEGMYLFEPRTASTGTLPFTDYQKLSAMYVSTVSGVEQWEYRHPFINTSADLSASARVLEVIRPTSWSASGSYPTLHALPALGKSIENAALDFTSGDYANTYNCVIVMPRFDEPGGKIPWYGMKNDNTDNQHGFVADVMTAFSEEFLAGASGKENHLLLGYSKSANGAYSLILRNPTKFGYACGWDGPWVLDWDTEAVSFGLDTAFGTEAQFDLYDPYQILAANVASVNDKKRLVLLGYETFQQDQVDMKALLDANSVLYTYDATDTGDHSFGGGWLDDAVAELFALKG